jgi:hypothetical protein
LNLTQLANNPEPLVVATAMKTPPISDRKANHAV